MNISANIIAFMHLLLIIFITVIPFITDNPFFLLYYVFILFFIMFHWYLNDDTCILTIIESRLRGKKDRDTFMGKLIKPIYNISGKEIRYLAIFLFLFALIKIRFWEKERYELIYRNFYVKIKVLLNKYKKVSSNDMIDFIINPLQKN